MSGYLTPVHASDTPEAVVNAFLSAEALQSADQEVVFPARESIGIFPLKGDNRTQNQGKIDLENRYRENARSPLGLAGLLCCRVRTEILGESKLGLSRATGITRDTLARLEAGTTEPNTYRRLLAALRERVLETIEKDPVTANRIEQYRTRIAKLLVQESGLKHPLNQLMLELGFRYGKDTVESAGGFNLVALRARDKKGGCGVAVRNFAAVSRVMRQALVEEGKLVSSPIDDQELLWTQNEMKQLIALEVQERLKPLTGVRAGDAAVAEVTALVLTLLSLKGAASREVLVSEYDFSSPEARALPRGQVEQVAPAAIGNALKKLVAEGVLPLSVAGATVEKYTGVYMQRSYLNRLPNVAREIHQGLSEQGIDQRLAASLLVLNRERPGHAVKTIIDDLAIENSLFSFHALCCLAAPTLPDTETLVEGALTYARNLPKNAGREFSFPFQLAVMYGLQAKDFTGAVRDAVAERYAEEVVTTPQSISETIMQKGDSVSLAVLNRWLTIVEPKTASQTADALDARRVNVSSHLGALGMAQSTLRKYQNGELFPPLKRLEGLLREADVVPSVALLVHWYMHVASNVDDALARGVLVYMRATDGNGKAFYLNLLEKAEEDLALSLRDFQKLLTRYARNERTATDAQTYSSDRLLLQELEKGKVPQEVLVYLTLAKVCPDLVERFACWESEMRRLNREDLLTGFEELLKQLDTLAENAPPENLESAFALKQEIARSLSRPFQKRWQAVIDTPVVKALQAMPGITLSELKTLRDARSAVNWNIYV